MISEKSICERSYAIWLREGRPDGKALEHWLRAKAELELEAEMFAPKPQSPRGRVEPLPAISMRPRRKTSMRVAAAGEKRPNPGK